MNKTKKAKLAELYEIYYHCDPENPLYIEYATQFVPGHGNADANIVLIGEAPGEIEEKTGLPFQGRSGKLLRSRLAHYDITENNSFITNVVKFRPPQNRKPTPQEIEDHVNLILFHELEIIAPKLIVTVGAVATEVILGKNIKMTLVRGKIFFKKETIVIPIFHPAYILRNMSALPIFEQDIAFIKMKSEKI